MKIGKPRTIEISWVVSHCFVSHKIESMGSWPAIYGQQVAFFGDIFWLVWATWGLFAGDMFGYFSSIAGRNMD